MESVSDYNDYCCVQKWDHTNFLVDLSGHHAHCKAVRHQPGVKEIHRRTPQGQTIVAAVDFIDGHHNDRRAIHQYVQEVIKRWENTNRFIAQVNCFTVTIQSVCESGHTD